MKKILTVSLALVMMLCVSMMTFATAGAPKITGMAGPLSIGYSGSTDLGEIHPIADSHIVTIDLIDTMFLWDDGGTGTGQQLTPSQIRENRLAVRTGGSSKAIKDVSINNRDGRIEVKFIDEHVSTKELDFTVDVYLTIDGKRQSDQGITFTGTLANPVIDIYAGDAEANISDGTVAHAAEFNSKIEFDLGNDVTLATKLFKGKDYYGVARLSHMEDKALNEKHPEIEMELILKTVGFGTGADTIHMGGQYSGYYVYDDDLHFLGKADDSLAFRSKYYLSTKKLDVEVEDKTLEEPTASTTPPSKAPEQVPESGPTNANQNPNTGR